MSDTRPTDGRSALREERGRAILAAARELATEHGADGFTIDTVAESAGVSRRTVFNHYATVDHLLAAVCEQVLDETTSTLLAELDRRAAASASDRVGDSSTDAVLVATYDALRAIDLATPVVTLHRVLGCPEPTDERAMRITRIAFDRVADRVRVALLALAPDLDVVDLELTLALVFNGLGTLAGLWLDARPDMGTEVTPEARTVWDDLLSRLLTRLQYGHTPHAS